MSDQDEISDEAMRMMDSSMENFPNVSAPIDFREPPSRYCEVWISNRIQCGKAATHAYPAQGGGVYMSLCSAHAKKHPEAWPIKEIL